jgi:hypothetical protein
MAEPMSPAPAIATSKDFMLRFYLIRLAYSREWMLFDRAFRSNFKSEFAARAMDIFFLRFFFLQMLYSICFLSGSLVDVSASGRSVAITAYAREAA